jgi:hypothetical protein
MPSLFETLRRLPTSATAFYDVRATKPGLFRILAGTETSISFLFSTCHALSLAGAVTRGEPRYVRWQRPQCWFLSLARACPTVMPPSPPHLQIGLAPNRSIVRIDVHGSEDRAKDASPGACDDLSCLRRVHAHRSRMPTAFPSSASSGHPLSSARLMPRVDLPATRVGPTKVLVPTTPREERRLSEDRDAFHRHDTRRKIRHAKGLLPPAFAPAPSLTPPTLFPQEREVFLMGIARSRCGHPRIREQRLSMALESADAFSTRRDFRAWD